ncbi:MAG: hypothetical protein JXR87_08560 [Candidatus Marinimicrobia bacterium]|nr:hypothetical protein [Candidatus Neomarinimicrobiota bacterium]
MFYKRTAIRIPSAGNAVKYPINVPGSITFFAPVYRADKSCKSPITGPAMGMYSKYYV